MCCLFCHFALFLSPIHFLSRRSILRLISPTLFLTFQRDQHHALAFSQNAYWQNEAKYKTVVIFTDENGKVNFGFMSRVTFAIIAYMRDIRVSECVCLFGWMVLVLLVSIFFFVFHLPKILCVHKLLNAERILTSSGIALIIVNFNAYNRGFLTCAVS